MAHLTVPVRRLGLPSWLTREGLLTPVEMGLKMWERNNVNIYNLFVISSLQYLNGGEGGIRTLDTGSSPV